MILKYDEIMEHIQITDEMQERILSNITHHFTQKKKRFKYLTISGIAAAMVLICGLGLWKNQNLLFPSDKDPSYELLQGTYEAQEYSSASELAAAVKFPVPELKSVPFDFSRAEYTAISNDLAEIRYYEDDGSNVLTFRKSQGTEENSGDYTQYSTEDTVKVKNLTVTLKGEGNKICLAYWTDGQYAYSIGLDYGCDRTAILQLISEIMENK